MADGTPPLPDPARINLRDLALPVRLVLAVFLISVGIGYVSALVQLHFKEAKPGQPLPDAEDALRTYHGTAGMGQFERLITEPENRPWGAGGTMRPAFTSRSSGWSSRVRQTKTAFGLDKAQAENLLRSMRQLEVQAIVDWIHAGAKKETYAVEQILNKDLARALPLVEWKKMIEARPKPAEGEELPEPPTLMFEEDENGNWRYNVDTIIQERCVRCHKPSGSVSQIDLSTYEGVKDYIPPVDDPSARGMSLGKLAQTTHVHLLGFSVLYGLTGLLFAFTSYPLFLRVLIAPLPLLAQVVDISFWWLSRMDAPHGELFAHLIPITGMIVAGSLLVQILFGLFALFGWFGRFVLVLLIAGVLASAHFFVKPIVEDHLQMERESVMKIVEPTK